MIEPAEFSWLVAVALFFLYIVMDILWGAWMISVNQRRPVLAASESVVIYVFGAFATISYIENHWYLIPVAAGAFIGSYAVTRWHPEKKLPGAEEEP